MNDDFIGKTFISKEPFILDFLIFYAAPYTGQGQIEGPNGMVLKIKYSQGSGRYSCTFDNEEFKKAVHAEAEKESINNDLLEGKYSGFDPMISKYELISHFEEVKE